MNKQNMNPEKTLDSEKFKSDSSSRLMSSRLCDTHLRNCGYKYSNTCICDHLIKLTKAHDKRLAESRQNISQSSDSFHSIILAGSERCFSQKSSENSFHSAESTITTTKLPITDCKHESTSATGNSLENNTESSKEIESSFAEPCSSYDVLNENIHDEIKASARDDTSEQSDTDLNKAQDLFKSTSINDDNANNNINYSINTSHSLSNEENLHFLLENQSTTIYHEIPQFLKNYSALLHNDGDDTSKEVTRRLTRSFYNDPQEFAKRLMTIIEEPETNCNMDSSAISVDKLTAAFLKMCKYIEDESMPSICDNTDRYESIQLPSIHPVQDNTTDHLLSQGTSTPIYSHKTGKIFNSKISPFGKKKNTLNIQSSPLYISTLTRATGSPKTPIIIENPKSSTPDSAQNHNDSSFTFWERKCEVRPVKINNNSAPILTDEEMKRIAKSEEQLRMLQAAESPNKSPIKAKINIYNIHCDREKSKNELRITLEFPSDSIAYTRSDAPLDDDENDMTESILYELAEKRKRCSETERTIRRIDAESSAHSNSVHTSENEESVKILEYLNTLKDGADFQKILTNDKNELSQQHCHDSEIDNRSLSQNPRICRNESTKLTDKGSTNLIIAQNNSQHNITKRKKLLKIPRSREESLNVNILKIGLPGHYSESSKSNTYIQSPALMSRRVVSSNLVLRSVSPIDSQSVNESVSPSILQTKKTPRSLRPLIHTPRAKSPNLKVYSQNSYKLKNQLCSKTRMPSSVATTSSLNPQATSNTLSTGKLPTGCKSTVQLLTSNKGFTLKYMNSISHSRSSHVKNHGILSKANKSQSESKHCANFDLTPFTPLENVCVQHNGILKEKTSSTPLSSDHNKGGKFFNTPGKTPVPKIRPKPISYFSVDNVKKSIFKSQYIDRNCNPNEVKSPVAEYIYGTDTTLIQNIRGKKNESLLTPTKKKEVSEQLKCKLTAKNNSENKSKENPDIFDYEADSISDINDENNDTSYNHPKVSYQLPSVIHEIKTDVNTPRGFRARRLMETNDSRVIIKHAGRAIPQIGDVTELDTSIHIPKSAEKQKFVFQPNNNKHH